MLWSEDWFFVCCFGIFAYTLDYGFCYWKHLIFWLIQVDWTLRHHLSVWKLELAASRLLLDGALKGFTACTEDSPFCICDCNLLCTLRRICGGSLWHSEAAWKHLNKLGKAGIPWVCRRSLQLSRFGNQSTLLKIRYPRYVTLALTPQEESEACMQFDKCWDLRVENINKQNAEFLC